MEHNLPQIEATFNGEPIPFPALIEKMLDDIRNDWPPPILASERPPKTEKRVLIWTDAYGWEKFNTGCMAFDEDGNWISRDDEIITHWFPLPPDPVAEKP